MHGNQILRQAGHTRQNEQQQTAALAHNAGELFAHDVGQTGSGHSPREGAQENVGQSRSRVGAEAAAGDDDLVRLQLFAGFGFDEELFLFSNITGTKYAVKGNLQLKKKVGDDFFQDIFDHEQCLVLSQEGKKILMSGCAHNGIINILDRYYELLGEYPDVVISGFHMMQKDVYTKEDISNIEQIGKVLLETGALFYSGHCTGQPAYDILKGIMGETLQPIHSGESILL